MFGLLRRHLWQRPASNLAALDGLRGVASVIITVYHVALFTGRIDTLSVRDLTLPERVIHGLWSGIDIFFVLSGFLIGRILITDLVASGGIRYRRFFVRRSFRIFPAYYLILSLSVFGLVPVAGGLLHLLFNSSDPGEIQASAWSNYAYLSNYVSPGHQPNPLAWGWSLCVEEHFYLLLPPLLLLLFKLPPARRLPGLTLAVLLPWIGRLVQYAANPDLRLVADGFYFYSHNRFDEIFVGVLLAYLHVVHPTPLLRVVKWLGSGAWVMGVGAIAAVWILGGLFVTGAFAVVWQFTLLAIGSGLLLLNGLYLDNIATRFLAHPIWYPLARVSYGSYLVHPFVLFGILQLYADRAGVEAVVSLGWPGFGLLCAALLVLSTSVAGLLFLLVERPMLELGARLS